eukprot:SAG31_NODE_11616_length_1013_cov_1.071116_1_plen_78_part_00
MTTSAPANKAQKAKGGTGGRLGGVVCYHTIKKSASKFSTVPIPLIVVAVVVPVHVEKEKQEHCIKIILNTFLKNIIH